mmetsp:Transcript_111637/g.315737  ORF Transcript_111637/g.315737 Transcript_111637/m.315737 type:complete len:245 (+) Transcript_111637:909-1643(+)
MGHQEEAEALQRAEDDPEQPARRLRHGQDRVVREAVPGVFQAQRLAGSRRLRHAVTEHGPEGVPPAAVGPAGQVVQQAAPADAAAAGNACRLAGNSAHADAAPAPGAPLRASGQGAHGRRRADHALHPEAGEQGRAAAAQGARSLRPAPRALWPVGAPDTGGARGRAPGRPPRRAAGARPGQRPAHRLPDGGRHGARHRPAASRLGLPRSRGPAREPVGRPAGLAQPLGCEVLARPARPLGRAG